MAAVGVKGLNVQFGLSAKRGTWLHLVDRQWFRLVVESVDCFVPSSSSLTARRWIYEFDSGVPTNWMSIAFGRQFVSPSRRAERCLLGGFWSLRIAVVNDFPSRSSRQAICLPSINISNQTAIIIRLTALQIRRSQRIRYTSTIWLFSIV